MSNTVRNRNITAALALLAALGVVTTAPTLAQQQGKPKAKPTPKPAAKAAPAGKSYTYGPLTFQCALPLSAPVDYNQEGASFFYPAGVKPHEDRLRVFIGTVDALTAKDLGARGTLNKAMTNTYMGLGTEPIGTKARTMLGQENTGDIHEVNYDPPRHVEAHIVTLPNGTTYYVAFEYNGKTHAAKFEALAESAAKSLKVK